ncbi:23S rRNA (uracil(1939)-C(5))-methyltransferase RlmD [Latilactobacillus sakei]|uniref:23S rRNA (Uracil(1939)-C(5))-methyltransferase RlmD n=1 Tax=Latilactobacillus sakei TaxID=1599 RepID=A0AAX0VBU3_LATSK|nr:23S rRNA (uracil(1939)-C(5))-methyltransferase RlmD [Latilactobacillus sakei]PKX72032.1 23S rRNA (uracil(1939)-C(5))-methyltransferase RlmD [Latilactobacillus sakei]PKX79069.1 23S rRNA (uracil(1939)-C(5))-methyltransferase RlmD [Latilactobacillus sakei]
MKIQAPVRKNEKLTVDIMDLTYEGMGVAKVDNYPLFIEGVLPDEQAEVEVTKVNKQYGFARLVNLLKKSPDRVESKANIYSQTGIAPLQHLAYPAQLTFKRNQILNVFQKAHLDIPVQPTLGMTDPTGYRNKAQVPVRFIDGALMTGFYRKHSHQVMPMEDFYIQDPKIDEAIKVVRDILRRFYIDPYNEDTHKGVLRTIMVRHGYYSHEMMIVFITRSKKLPAAREIAIEIKKALPEVVSIMQNVNAAQTNVIFGDQTKLIAGRDFIRDELMGLKFEISAQSFYQVNPVQTEVLYQEAIEAAELTGNETVIDAYSGIGTISLAVAKHAKQVYGVEVVESAVMDARHNAKINAIDNVEFTLGKAEDVMAQWQTDGLQVDALIVDPPRKGLEPSFIEAVGQLKPAKMVYVSCNPATLARDLDLLAAQGYQAEGTQPVDMFPQTLHVESVTKLVLK